ncbi:MAG: hypothetical protein ACI865_002129 [Flavobacteriaceae bacterium]|jgi:hypothetical protein
MIKIILVLLLVTSLSPVHSKEMEKVIVQYWLESSTIDDNLSDGQSVYEFKFDATEGDGKQSITYSIDGISHNVALDNSTFEVSTTPGPHIFQIYYSDDYVEIYTDSLTIQNQHRATYRLTLWNNVFNLEMDKPVIYLYPKTETDVSVKLDVKGVLNFTYPRIDKSWEFVAHPNGDLVFGNKTFNYLFWESSQNRYLNHVELKSGFVVEKANVVSFLEEKLTLAGLTAKEQADFITYWGPRLAAHDKTFVHFEFNEACNRYAELDISPKPDNLYRIYIGWKAIYTEMEPTPQIIKPIDRNGFTVLEWGGYQVTEQQIN